ncbi:hypothetical protein JD844_003297 [Phrynosoma platyrhinos]|uniref:Sperm-associated antigen 6 n=1 Tax=Phrynosoma platyrhinos TaxID=52577 RepID=A0ABQ7TCP1_PHRPL|nr:hypothetical protein JD844_003297 [Phrynosoma platyrhinos]
MVHETRRADLKCRCQGTEVHTLLSPSCCICQGEKWLAQGSVTHTHLITFIGPTELSQAVVDAGAIPLLVLCIQEPEIALRRIAASALSDVSKHSPELAQTVVDAGAIAHLAQMILNPDAKLKRQVLSALSQIAKHSVDLAEMVVEAEIFPVVLTCLKDSDEYVKKNAATLIREIARHTPELSQLIVNAGGVAAVIDCVGSCKGNVRLPGIMMLGYVAAHSENLAMAVIISKGVPQLAVCLSEEPEDHIKAAAAWSLGQIGRHTPEHARAVAVANVLPVLLSLYMASESSEDLQVKTKKALKNILQKCTHLPALEPLLHDAPPNILKHVVGQFSKVLPHDSKARRLFVTSGGLKKVQEIKAEAGSLLQEYINTINNCYPEEIVSDTVTVVQEPSPSVVIIVVSDSEILESGLLLPLL